MTARKSKISKSDILDERAFVIGHYPIRFFEVEGHSLHVGESHQSKHSVLQISQT